MDEILYKKIEQKIQDIISDKENLENLSKLIPFGDSKSFVMGMIVGRLYNAFFYQSKRILDREPTKQETREFIKFIESKKSVLENLW